MFSHKGFLARMKKSGNPNIKILSKYAGQCKPITCLCTLCNRQWDTTPKSLYTGSGCIYCARGGPKKRQKKFLKDLRTKGDPRVEIVGGQYDNGKSPIDCKCKECGRTWTVQALVLLKGGGCRVCDSNGVHYGRSCKTTEEFKEDMLTRGQKNVEIIGKYTNVLTHVKCQCKVCGFEWRAKPSKLLNGSGCSRCVHEELRKTHDEFITEVSKTNPNLLITGQYVASQSKVEYECKICGLKHSATANSLSRGFGCPGCASSKGEGKISEYLDNNDITYVKEARFSSCQDKRPLPFDFFIPASNLLIEYDGEQHFVPVSFGGKSQSDADNNYEITKAHDAMKTKWASDNGYTLLRIPYTTFNDIDAVLESEVT